MTGSVTANRRSRAAQGNDGGPRMTDDLPANAPPEPTEVRFRLRSLLISTAVVAVVAAIAGTYYRSVPPGVQARLNIVWGVVAILVALWLVVEALHRYRAERKVGAVIVRLPSPASSWTRIIGAGVIILIGLGYLGLTSVVSAPTPGSGISLGECFSSAFLPALCISAGISGLWWHGTARVCQNGVLAGRQLLLWSHVVDARWQYWPPDTLHLTGVGRSGGDVHMRLIVPPPWRQLVDDIVQQKLKSGAAVSATSPARWGPAAVGKRRVAHEVRVVMSLLLGIIYLVAFFVIGLDSADLLLSGVVAVNAVLLAWVAPHGYLTARRAGPPLVRVRMQARWARVASTVGVAILCYTWLMGFPPENVWLLRGLAAVASLAAAYSIALILAESLDLRENGIVLHGCIFRSWTRVGTFHWKHGVPGRLVLSHGWRRVVANVPPDQRAAVEALMREKLPT